MASNSTLGDAALGIPIARVSHPVLLATTWSLVAFVLLFLVARISINLYAFKRFQIADGFAAFAFGMLIVNAVLMTVMAPNMYELFAVSVGSEVPGPGFPGRVAYFLKCQFASTLVFWTCLWSIKASFLAFFYQLTQQLLWPRRAWWAITGFTALAYVGSMISYPISCTSFEIGGCSPPENVFKSLISLRLSTAVDIFTDICIIALPVSIVGRARLSWKQKLGLFGVLGLGVFIIGVAIARIIVTDTEKLHPEVTWLALWSVVESSVAVLMCCLASFKALFKAQSSSTHNSRSYHVQGSGRGRGQREAITSQEDGAIVLAPVKTSPSTDSSWDRDSSSQAEILGGTTKV